MKNWKELYFNQDLVLENLKDFKDYFTLGGGTALHRFLLFDKFRYSEDLDIFLDKYISKKSEMKEIAYEVANNLKTISQIKEIELKPLNNGNDYRLMCYFNNNEHLKIDILNFNFNQKGNYKFLTNNFKIENFYDLMLYKIAAFCDRADGIKDLFDLYFIFQQFDKVDFDKVFQDLNEKLSIPLGRKFFKEDMLNILQLNLKWNILLKNEEIYFYAEKEIKNFQKLLYKKLKNNEPFNFSISNLIQNRANEIGIDKETYIEIIDYIEDNRFLLYVFKNNLDLSQKLLQAYIKIPKQDILSYYKQLEQQQSELYRKIDDIEDEMEEYLEGDERLDKLENERQLLLQQVEIINKKLEKIEKMPEYQQKK